MTGIKIKKKYDIQVKSKISDYLNPDYCFVPINEDAKLIVNINDRVFKNQPLIVNTNGYIDSSPISGTITEIKVVKTISGQKKSIVIKNDFKEKSVVSKGVNSDFTKYNNLDLNSIMKNCGVTYYDDKNEYFSFNSKKPKVLVINAVEDEPYVANYSILLKTKLDEILETTDDLALLLGIEKIYFAINDYETEVINNLINILGTFPNIELKLISNRYPSNIQKTISNEINQKDIITLNLSTLHVIVTALKKERNITSKLITITGNLISEPKVISVKLGSNIETIIEENFKIKKSDNMVYVANGLINGIQLDDLDIIVTADLKSIMLFDYVPLTERDCDNCGACVRVSPSKINIKYSIDYKKKSAISDEDIGCCNYICPANHNFFKEFSNSNKKNNQVLIHSENTIAKTNYRYLLVLIPLIIFGFYKNGIIVFQNNKTDILGLFLPLIIPTVSYFIGYFVTVFFNKFYYHKPDGILANYNLPILTLIIGMLLPININIIISFLTIFILTIIYIRFFYQKKISINFITLTTLIVIIINLFISKDINLSSLYLNNYEITAQLNSSIIRLLFGYNYSGIAASNIVLVIIGYIYLSSKINYKKEIPLYSLMLYILMATISLLFFGSVNDVLRNIMSSSFIFLLIFAGTDNRSTPYTILGMVIYCFIIALFTLIIGHYNFELALLFAISIASIFTNIINKVFRKTKFSKQ